MAKGRRPEDKTKRRSNEAAFKQPAGVKLLRTLEEHRNTVRSVAFDPAFRDREDAARSVAFDPAFREREDTVCNVAFDPTGQTLASASTDATVKLWKVASGKLIRTLEGHCGGVRSVAFDPRGRVLASGSSDLTVRLWEPASGRLLRTLEGHTHLVRSVAFDRTGQTLASGSDDGTVKLWEVASGRLIRTLKGHGDCVWSVAFDPKGQMLASASRDRTVKLWEVTSRKPLRTLEGHEGGVRSVAFDPKGQTLASASRDRTVKLWARANGRLLGTLEGHTDAVEYVAFSSDGQLLASRSDDDTVRLWRCDTWETVAVVREPASPVYWTPALAFHPISLLLATAGSGPNTPSRELCRVIHLWEPEMDVLQGKRPGVKGPSRAVHHTTVKIVLVGDSGVGKTGLGWRLAHGEFREHSSTHGQQFWVLGQLGIHCRDGTECEAVLWDLAGQPDYRLIHALFLDDADLALVLFDPTDRRDPLHGVEFWLRQLGVDAASQVEDHRTRDNPRACPALLVAARCDRGMPTLAQEELDAFVRNRGLGGYICTSAKNGQGLEDLIGQMKSLIPWDQKATIVTTVTFKRIKDYVLKLKESPRKKKVILTPSELRERLVKTKARWRFTDAEMMTAVGHLETYGYVKRLHTSKGEERILLVPELLNNLAASFVVQARANPKGLGSLEEKRLLTEGYPLQELKGLTQDEQNILLDSATLLFIGHHVCLRETDPLTQESYLVFPELINLKKPILENEKLTEDGVAYTVSGPVENVFASLVVLLGYTHTFTRTNQWQNHARYEVGNGLVCGFRQEAEREGELDFVLYFCQNAPQWVRMLFQSLFENFLARRNLTVMRFEPVKCSKGHIVNQAVIREALQHRQVSAFCPKCGRKLRLPKAEPIQLTREQQAEVDAQRRVADERTRFEQVIFRVRNYVTEQKIKIPECFISYAWGVTEHERWVESSLAKDLQKAGIKVVLDRWENAKIGASVMRFVERIDECDRVIVVGTPLYRQKARNVESESGSVAAAEYDMVGIRLLGTEKRKREILPTLLAGDPVSALPPLLQGRVYADFRKKEGYFLAAFDLILSLYGIAPSDSAVADLRESLGEPRMR